MEAAGSFVTQVELFQIARQIDPMLAHTKKRSAQDYNERFRPFLLRYLSPAVQEYVHCHGTAGHKQTQVSFYMCPTGSETAQNLKASFAGLLATCNEREVNTRLSAIPLKEYIQRARSYITARVALTID